MPGRFFAYGLPRPSRPCGAADRPAHDSPRIPRASAAFPESWRCHPANVTREGVAQRREGQKVPGMETPLQPAARALAAPDKPPAETAAVAPRRISKKIIAAIDAMVTGDTKTIKEAAEKVGLARESLSRALSK